MLTPAYNYDRYQAFVDLVGTHIITQVSVGGFVRHSVVVDNYASKTTSSSTLGLNAKSQWQNFVTGNFNASNGQSYT